MAKVNIVLFIILVSFLVGGSFFIIIEYRNLKAEIGENFFSNYSQDQDNVFVLPVSQPNYIPVLNSNIPKPDIDARAAVIYDTNSSRILYEKNINEKLPIASLTKVLSAVVIIENFDLDEIVTISEDSIRVDGERQDLFLGESISVRNLLKLMLIESSNDAAYALDHYADMKDFDFVETMNLKADEIKMKESHFTDPAGLDDQAYSTVQDLIKLVEYSLNYPEIWDISVEKTAIVESIDSNIKHNITTTNRLLGLLTDIIGGKTGRTEGALECLILITRVKDYPSRVISIVLGSHDRFSDTQELINWSREAYRWE